MIIMFIVLVFILICAVTYFIYLESKRIKFIKIKNPLVGVLYYNPSLIGIRIKFKRKLFFNIGSLCKQIHINRKYYTQNIYSYTIGLNSLSEVILNLQNNTSLEFFTILISRAAIEGDCSFWEQNPCNNEIPTSGLRRDCCVVKECIRSYTIKYLTCSYLEYIKQKIVTRGNYENCI